MSKITYQQALDLKQGNTYHYGQEVFTEVVSESLCARPEDVKKPQKLMAEVNAQDFFDEVLRLLSKEELFPKKSRWQMAEKIADNANDFLDTVCYANNIIADTPDLAVERHNAQRKAFALCKVVNSGLERARRHYKFNPDYLKNVMRLYNSQKALLTSWISYDKKRFEKLFGTTFTTKVED